MIDDGNGPPNHEPAGAGPTLGYGVTMRLTRTPARWTTGLAALALAGGLARADLYWTVYDTGARGGGVYRSNNDGSGAQRIWAGNWPTGIDFDETTGTLVWSDLNGDVHTADADGNGATSFSLATSNSWNLGVLDGQVFLNRRGLSADPAAGVFRINLDGTGATQLTSGNGGEGLAIDHLNGRVRWQSHAEDARPLYSMNPDGSDVELTVSNAADAFFPGMAVGERTGDLYFAGQYDGTSGIFRRDQDGSEASQVLIADIGDAFSAEYSLVVSESADRIYFGSRGLGAAIYSMSLDGSGITELAAVDEAFYAMTVTGIPAPGTAGLLALGLLARRRRR